MTRENQKIDGDLTVERDIITGGGLLSRGNSLFKKNVRIEGCLYVRNIKGPCLGLFSSIEHVRMIYPRASEGSIALIGKTLPAAVWVVQCGQWIPTGESGGEFSIDLHDYLSKEEAELHYVSRAEYTDLEARLRAVEQNCNCNGGGGTEFLESVTLLSPAGGVQLIEGDGDEFLWEGITGAKYILEVARDSMFADIIYSAETVVASHKVGLAMLTVSLEAYYWRVRAEKSGYVSSVSQTEVFYYSQRLSGDEDPGDSSNGIMLVSPSNGTGWSSWITFKWTANGLSEGVTFKLLLSQKEDMSEAVEYDCGSDTECEVNAVDLKGNVTHYWQVVAYNGEEIAGESEIRNIRVVKQLATIVLAAPATGAVVDENFIFQWQMHGLNANITYTLQVSTDANFDNIICEQSVVDQSAISSTGMPLEPGMTYYWRVKVTNEDYIGSMSNTHSLTMAGEAVTPQMYYGYISAELSDYSDITDAMIKAGVENGTVVQQDLQTLEKTAISGLSAGDSLVVLLPLSSGYVATSDSGIGTKVPFITEVMGANGDITLDIEGVTYKVYGEFMLLSGTKYIYVD